MARGRSTLFVAIGWSLIVLGIGNATIGWVKMVDYRARKHDAIAAGGESVRLPFSGTPSMLDPSTDAQLLYELATLKYEYYRVMRRGGFLFMLFGAGMIAFPRVRARLSSTRTDARD